MARRLVDRGRNPPARVSIAAAALIEVALGIRPYFYAFLEAAVAMCVAVLLAGAWRSVRNARGALHLR